MSCGVGHICGSDSALLWLWCRPAAIVLIQPLDWEPPYAMGLAPRIKKHKVLHIGFELRLSIEHNKNTLTPMSIYNIKLIHLRKDISSMLLEKLGFIHKKVTLILIYNTEKLLQK